MPPQDKARAAFLGLLARRERREIVLRIPNFCMAECSKAFAEIIYSNNRSQENARDEYGSHVEALLNLVSKQRRGFVESYALQRKHLVNIEEIFEAQYRIKSPNRTVGMLSGLDGLIISMATALLRWYGPDDVIVATGDDWLARVCNQNRPTFPKAFNIFTDPVPG